MDGSEISLLGSGLTSHVFLSQFGQRQVAVKQFKDSFSYHQRRNEIRILSMLDHPNLVRLIAHEENYRWSIMELCSSRALDDALSDYSTLPDRKEIARCICQAVQYLHSQNIVHRDIKSRNVMFHAETGQPVLGDFGLSEYVGEQGENTQFVLRYVGTKGYMAPELSSARDMIPLAQLMASDIYSLGVLIFEIWMGYMPFNSPTISTKKYDAEAQWSSFWKRQKVDAEQEFRQLLQSTMCVVPTERWTIQQVLDSDWFK